MRAKATIDTPLPFGKHKGYSPRQLAAAGEVGRNYLMWGATDLQSDHWRAAFSAALAAPITYDPHIEIKVLYGLDADEFAALEEIALPKTELGEYEAGLLCVCREYAAHFGVTLDQAQAWKATSWREGEWAAGRTFTEEQFSEPAKYQLFIKFMQALDEIADTAPIW